MFEPLGQETVKGSLKHKKGQLCIIYVRLKKTEIFGPIFKGFRPVNVILYIYEVKKYNENQWNMLSRRMHTHIT